MAVKSLFVDELDYRNAEVHKRRMAKRIDYQALMKAIRAKTGDTQAQLAERVGVSQPSISRWLGGTPPELHHAVLIDQVATKLQLAKDGNDFTVTTVPIVGYVGAGGTISFEEGQGPFGEADMPPNNGSPSLVAVSVRGDSMSGVLEDGWTVYYENREDGPQESMHSKLCVVGLQDGRVLIKKLYPGRMRGHYDLHSANAPALLDQPVKWAARVTWIAPS